MFATAGSLAPYICLATAHAVTDKPPPCGVAYCMVTCYAASINQVVFYFEKPQDYCYSLDYNIIITFPSKKNGARQSSAVIFLSSSLVYFYYCVFHRYS